MINQAPVWIVKWYRS